MRRVIAIVGSVVIVGLLTGCAGRRISASVQDQTFVPGPSPRVEAPIVGEAKVVPVVPVPPEPVPPAPVQQPPTERTVPPEPPKVGLLPTPPASPPQPGSLVDVYFDFDQFSIRTDAQAVLEVNAQILKGDHTARILIEGHCDERGTIAYNLVLGERRANAAKSYLRELGVPASQIDVVSYGKERPFCLEHSETCWQSNRRAHFRRP
jgi:peptidoglycan-associated lipoprotein